MTTGGSRAFPFPGSTMDTSEVFNWMDTFLEHHIEWPDTAIDSQGNDVQLVVANGVRTSRKNGNLIFCWFSDFMDDDETYHRLLHCECSASSVDCGYTLNRVEKSGKLTTTFGQPYDIPYLELKDQESGVKTMTWVFDIMRVELGQLHDDAVEMLRRNSPLPWSSEILKKLGKYYHDSPLTAPPGWTGTINYTDIPFAALENSYKYNQGAKCTMEGMWTAYKEAKKNDASGKPPRLPPSESERKKQKTKHCTPSNGRSKPAKTNARYTPKTLREAEEGFKAICLYIACFGSHCLDIEWNYILGSGKDVELDTPPDIFPWVAEQDCPSIPFWHDVGEGLCCWYSATIASALALGLTKGHDGSVHGELVTVNGFFPCGD